MFGVHRYFLLSENSTKNSSEVPIVFVPFTSNNRLLHNWMITNISITVTSDHKKIPE